MKKIADIIISRYKRANFLQVSLPNKDIIRFQNDFSTHYVFIFDDLKSLKENWKKSHEILIKDYLEHDGPRYMEWNYYAVFFVSDVYGEETDFEIIRLKIESDTSYSRKYLVKEIDLNDLPPGMISQEELIGKKVVAQNIRAEWEEALGSDLFKIITSGTKISLEERLRMFIEGKIEKK